ncbi:haloacid dehalogenase-type hydrolase [mine drainage metagenome]|jgi:HAD superfamily hydrolase (TIGR01509 family)|uniref:Haloacid dehalogenase-type hydrolase n=1 Tax=mine drainage metagenome TaxID=410659 RepID=T0XZK7_9ZZZZ
MRNVVFDIGWVFVHLDSERFLQFLRAHGADARDLNSVLNRVALHEHECGRLSGRELLERFAQLAPQPMDLAAAHASWVDMFELQPAMVALAHELSERYRVYLLSNIGDLHWAYLSHEYGLHRIGHGALPSFLAGVMKPEAGIYAEAERRFALEPAETVFIDDRAENVQAARGRGWQAIEHTGYTTTVGALRVLGVAC